MKKNKDTNIHMNWSLDTVAR